MLRRVSDRATIQSTQTRRKHTALATEHYLRDDVPCRSLLCPSHCTAELRTTNFARLPSDLSHYCLPDASSFALYSEAFLEEPLFQGMIVTQTSYRLLQSTGGRKQWQQAQAAVRDPRSGAILFSNEFSTELWRPCNDGESEEDYLFDLVYKAAVWYSEHLQQAIPIVVVTTNTAHVQTYAQRHSNVLVLQLHTYLEQFYRTVPSLLSRVAAIDAAHAASLEVDTLTSVATSEYGYCQHLTSDAIGAGVKSGLFLRGKLNVDRKGANAYVKAAATEEADLVLHADVVIQGAGHRNRALHGDVVAVQVLPEAEWPSPNRRAGRVVGLVEKRWRDTVVTLQESEVDMPGSKALTVPMDPRLPKIRISSSNKQALANQRLVVRLDDWPIQSLYPSGHLVRSLGPIGDLDTETAAMLIENTIEAPPFTTAQLAEMPVNTKEHPWSPSPTEVARRRDLRNSHFIFSIDPLGCEDVDDTLCVRRLDNGMTELSVHIADVSHFVRPGMLTDAEAASRGTTIYLADRRYDMLPLVLSADLCSLHDQVDRYAMSVIWTIDSDGNVVDTWFGRTLIRSAYKLHYELAQALFDGLAIDSAIKQVPNLTGLSRTEQESRVSELRSAVTMLIETARLLKAQRTGDPYTHAPFLEPRISIRHCCL
eukprot:m.271002 g.271002  ORF g.271002 m.271002 type:complete len:651 (+) comp17669_c1_seq3:38-1990(+)